MMLEHEEAVFGPDALDLPCSAAAICRVAVSVMMVIRSYGFNRRHTSSRVPGTRDRFRVYWMEISAIGHD